MTWTNALTPESLVNLHVFWLYKILTDSNSQVFLLFSSFLESWDGDEDKEEKQILSNQKNKLEKTGIKRKNTRDVIQLERIT